MRPATTRPEGGLLLLGESGAMEALRREIASAATTHAKVILLGETGVGKEVVARLIHAASPRAGQPFIAVNCSGIPETLLESELFGHVRGSFTGAFRDKPGLVRLAPRGTSVLYELGEMSLRMQAVLLRFAESGEVQAIGASGPMECVDVRLITATNCDLAKQVKPAASRQVLYYRLNVIRIETPPLRMRDRDMVLLLTHFLRQASAANNCPCPELTAGASEAIAQYALPGNIREVKNVVESRIGVRQSGATVGLKDLPAEIRSSIRVPRPTQNPPAAVRGDRLPAAALSGRHVAARLFAPLRSGEDS